MLKGTAAVLAIIYAPTMWGFVVLHGIAGLLGLFSPGRLSSVVALFTRNGPVRILGAVMMLAGTEMFIRAGGMWQPVLVKALGLMLFVQGGVSLFIPTVVVMMAEWVVALPAMWYRLAGAVSLGLAYLFFLATYVLPPEKTDSPAQAQREHGNVVEYVASADPAHVPAAIGIEYDGIASE